MTVIRLVNDAVDDIESEGRSAFLFAHLSLLRLPLGAFTGVGLGHGVLNATEAFFFSPLTRKESGTITQYLSTFLSLDLCFIVLFGFCCGGFFHPLIITLSLPF